MDREPTYRHVLPDRVNWIDLDYPTDVQRSTDMDDVLGAQVAAGGRPPLLRSWSGGAEEGIGVSRKDVQRPAGQAAMQQLQAAGAHVAVRGTGGTAVPAGPGMLHLSLILPRVAIAATTDDYYRMLCDALVWWLQDAYGARATVGPLPGSYCDGSYNVLCAGRKLIGTAQAWRGGLAGMASARPGYILAHAAIAIAIDTAATCQLINRFYELSGEAYRVNPETALSLCDLVPDRFAALTADAARQLAAADLRRSLQQHFTRLGVDWQAAAP